jgi:hypothetical protein
MRETFEDDPGPKKIPAPSYFVLIAPGAVPSTYIFTGAEEVSTGPHNELSASAGVSPASIAARYIASIGRSPEKSGGSSLICLAAFAV